MLMQKLLNLLREPNKRRVNENQVVRLAIDETIMLKKPEFLRVVFDIQEAMVNQASHLVRETDLNLELGAGVLPMKRNFSGIRSTDLVPSAHLDGVLDATNLNLKDNSTQTLYLQNTFHHLPDPQAFFDESKRVLKDGGRIIIVDPYFNSLSSFLYPILFKTETFDKSGGWKDASSHAMIGANQALSYIVFHRDIAKFERDNHDLRLIYSQPLASGLRYLLTGGLNFKSLAPDFLLKFLRELEKSRCVPKFFSLHWIVVLEKSENP